MRLPCEFPILCDTYVFDGLLALDFVVSCSDFVAFDGNFITAGYSFEYFRVSIRVFRLLKLFYYFHGPTFDYGGDFASIEIAGMRGCSNKMRQWSCSCFFPF